MVDLNNNNYVIKKIDIKCIFCGKNAAIGDEHRMSREHVIPQVIGGWLTIPFVCVDCNNNRFGAQFESELKKNGFIVAAIDRLGLQDKAAAYKSAKLTMVIDGDKPLLAYLDQTNTPRIFPQIISDGSMIVSEDKAKGVLQKQIERYERDTGHRSTFDIDSFDKLPYDIVIPVYGDDLSFIKRKNRESSITITELDKPIPFIVPAKIAFEHLAGFSYSFVLREEFNPIRDWLHHGDPNVNNHVRLNSCLLNLRPDELTYEPFHFVRLGYQEQCLSAIVGLFGSIVFSVFLAHIPDFSAIPFPEMIGPYHIYDVKNRKVFPTNAPEKIVKEDDQDLQFVSQHGHEKLKDNRR
jgi:hypothetical protein